MTQMNEPTADFAPDLKRAFAMVEDPSADDGFVVNVAAGVARREKRNRFGAVGRACAMAVAGAAAGYGLLQVGGAMLPQLQAALGPGLAEVLTAQTPAFSLGAPLLMLLGAAAGAGAAFVARRGSE